MPAVAERKLVALLLRLSLELVIMCRLCKWKKNRNIKSKNKQTHTNPATPNSVIITVEGLGCVFPRVAVLIGEPVRVYASIRVCAHVLMRDAIGMSETRP